MGGLYKSGLETDEALAAAEAQLEAAQAQGHIVILVDDGIATGSSIYAAINALQHMRVEKLVVAVPVAPASTCAWLRAQVDQLVCLYRSSSMQ
jgi:predicted phosphoribosyltransferase